MSLHRKTEHLEYVEGCFGCKVGDLQLSTGDASKPIGTKKWESRLSFYKDARAQGIQPAGTQREQVQAAYEASEKIGQAYDAGTMPSTKSISTLKETGVI